LESFETIFHQDLNGDGVIGLPPLPTTVIESVGSTSLTEIGNNFYLYNSSGSGPSLKYAGADVVAGQFGGFAPIGTEQTASGYDIAWKDAGTGQYTVWSADSSGNYIANIIGAVSGTSSSLESFETIFHQDLNGDGVIGLPPLPTTVIQVKGIDYTAEDATGSDTSSDSYSTSTGILTVSDGTNTANLHFTRFSGNFSFNSDGNGGTIVYDLPGIASTQNATASAIDNGASRGEISVITQAATTTISGTTITATSANQTLTGAGSNDTFIFAPGFGNTTITNFQPTNDVIQIDHSVFTNVQALLTATQEDGHGNLEVTADPHDTITLQNVTLAQLQAHQSDFHII
jgi:hypothetical protein